MSGIIAGLSIKPSPLAMRIMELAGFLCDDEVAYSAQTHPALVVATLPWRPEAMQLVAAFLRKSFTSRGGFAGQFASSDEGHAALLMIEMGWRDQLQELIAGNALDEVAS